MVQIPTPETGPTGYSWRDWLLFTVMFVPAAMVTWGIHEAAHWLMGTLLGYEMWISLNQVGLAAGEYQSTTHRIAVSIAGPVVTCLQAIGCGILIRQTRALWFYPFLFLTLWTRLLALAISLINYPNDEARVSLLLGWPIWLLPVFVVLMLAWLTWQANQRLHVGWKGNVLAYVAASVVTAIIVLSDQA